MSVEDQEDVLDIKEKDKHGLQIYEMTRDQAEEFFKVSHIQKDGAFIFR